MSCECPKCNASVAVALAAGEETQPFVNRRCPQCGEQLLITLVSGEPTEAVSIGETA